MTKALKTNNLTRSGVLSKLVIIIAIALVIVTFNIAAVWKGLKLSVVKVKGKVHDGNYDGNYDFVDRKSLQNSNKINNNGKRITASKTTVRSTHQNTINKEHHKNNFQTSQWDRKKSSSLCGTGWQDRYARLHGDIVASMKDERYLAYTCPGNRQGCCGYGNRLRAVVSLFYLSILTDRAFLIDWQTPEPIEDYLNPKKIQWNHSAALDVSMGLETRRHYWGTASAFLREAEGWITQDSQHFNNWFISTNFTSYFNMPIEEVTTIWYFVESGINKNTYLMRRARELNIKPLITPGVPKYALIGCAFDFLFEKSRAVENLLQVWRDEVRKTSGPVIGLHIRTGDAQFDYNSAEDERSNNIKNTILNGFFKCARHIEQKVFKFKEIRNSAQWFIATDNYRVKEYAKAKFPGKVITTNLTIQHLDILHNTTVSNDTIMCNFTTGINGSAFCYDIISFNKTLFCANRTNNTATFNNSTTINNISLYTNGIIAMLVDHFILSECDFLILCDSSFSSTAVGLSMRSTKSFVLGDRDCLHFEEAQNLRRLKFFKKKRSIN